MRYVLAMMAVAAPLVCACGVDAQAHDHVHQGFVQNHAVQGDQVERVRQVTARYCDIDVVRRRRTACRPHVCAA